VVTQRNDRTLHGDDASHVRNGALWTVTATHPDGSLTVHPVTRDGASVRLPATYVAEHVDRGARHNGSRAEPGRR
jgi:hypothetical protein